MNLEGKRILVTRPAAQAEGFTRALLSAKAQPVCFPTIRIVPPADLAPLDRALSRLECYTWLVLTSVNAVQAVWDRFEALEIRHLPQHLRIAAIGPVTATALEGHGCKPDLVPHEYVAEAILPGLGDIAGRWVLLPRAELARDALPDGISAAGGLAHVVVAYRTLPAEPDRQSLEALAAGIDVVTFTSSSTVRSFVDLVGRAGFDPLHLPGEPLIACIGPITARTALEAGYRPDVVADQYTVEGLVEALLRHENEIG